RAISKGSRSGPRRACAWTRSPRRFRGGWSTTGRPPSFHPAFSSARKSGRRASSGYGCAATIRRVACRRAALPSRSFRAELVMEHVVLAEHLSRRFGDLVAVRDVSLAVAAGEIFGILGPNGAGKSTTIRMLCGILEPTGGSGRVVGHDIRREPEA